ncbi:unnamed protein product, partial [Candidula unifasciata]
SSIDEVNCKMSAVIHLTDDYYGLLSAFPVLKASRDKKFPVYTSAVVFEEGGGGGGGVLFTMLSLSAIVPTFSSSSSSST